MTARDSYRSPVSTYEAIQELRRVSGKQLDARFVEIFVELLEGKTSPSSTGRRPTSRRGSWRWRRGSRRPRAPATATAVSRSPASPSAKTLRYGSARARRHFPGSRRGPDRGEGRSRGRRRRRGGHPGRGDRDLWLDRHPTVEDVQVRAADPARLDSDERLVGGGDLGIGLLLDSDLTGSLESDGAHAPNRIGRLLADGDAGDLESAVAVARARGLLDPRLERELLLEVGLLAVAEGEVLALEQLDEDLDEAGVELRAGDAAQLLRSPRRWRPASGRSRAPSSRRRCRRPR